jgi:hypothetical protein
MIGAYDLIVAATALERGSEVATFSRRHFDCVPGLKVIEPPLFPLPKSAPPDYTESGAALAIDPLAGTRRFGSVHTRRKPL